MHNLKIGFYVKWAISHTTNVIGDALLADSLCKALQNFPEVASAKLYAPDIPFDERLDVLIYLNNVPRIESAARIHVHYMQNGVDGEPASILRQLLRYKYDAHVFFSKLFLELFAKEGGNGLYLPFGVDTSFFCPHALQPEYEFDVSYVGNDIKGTERTMRYLYPAAAFNFGLFGNWRLPDINRRRPWKNIFFLRLPYYRWKFAKLSRGRIPQEAVPILYSSSKINLNCTLQACVDWDVVTLRAYEVLACRGFLLSDRVPAMETELQGCLVTTDGYDDLREKIAYYLAHDEERISIASKGYDHVVKHATVQARAEQLLVFLKKFI
ncbi:MAG: glycosyltransferase [Desulfovibrio desulfuricans]|nr:glycosyltransferase [Desulfovibrio desulfuricans]